MLAVPGPMLAASSFSRNPFVKVWREKLV